MSFVVSEGRIGAATDPPVPALPGALRFGDTYLEYGEIYRRQQQVRTVVSFLARNIAQLGLHTYRRVSDTDRERATGHPLAQLIRRPLPGKKLTRYQLVYRIVADKAVYDNAFLIKVRPDERSAPMGLLPVPPTRITPEGDSWIEAEQYRIHGSKSDLVLPADQVIHLHGYHPTDLRWGDSPIESLRGALLEEWEANRHRRQMWRNGARTSGFITRPAQKTGKDWSDAARERFKTEFRAVYTGDGPDAGGVPILEDGMAYVPAGLDPRQAQYIEARKLTREEVAAAYHIPPPLVGILDHATFSNIREQHRQLYSDTLGPWLVEIVEDLTAQLLTEFPDGDDLYVEFNISEKLRGSFEEQAAAASTSAGAPWMTVNEIRARNNLPAVDGGDELVTPLNVTKGGQASPRDSAPPPEPDDEPKHHRPRTKTRTVQVKTRPSEQVEDQAAEILARFFKRQARSVGSLLGAKTRHGKATAADVDWERWQGELALDLTRVNGLAAEDAGRAALEELGLDPDDYDPADVEAWLWENAYGQAEGTTETSRVQVQDALSGDDPGDALKVLFETWAASRAVELASRQTAHVGGYSSVVQARKVFGSDARKTWRTTSKNPRTTHARLNGQTVQIDATFGNGARWPGDSTLPAKEAAKCRCLLSITGTVPDEE